VTDPAVRTPLRDAVADCSSGQARFVIVVVRQTGEMVGKTDETVEAGGDPFGDGAEIRGDLWLIRCVRFFSRTAA
jgi:hypothetical protein